MRRVAVLAVNDCNYSFRDLLSLTLLERNTILLRDLGFRRIFLLNHNGCSVPEHVLERLDREYGIYLEEISSLGDLFGKISHNSILLFSYSNTFLVYLREELGQLISRLNSSYLIRDSTGKPIVVLGYTNEVGEEIEKLLSRDASSFSASPNGLRIVDLDANLFVTSEGDLKFWEKYLLKSVTKSEDGVISRHFNRKISLFMTKYLIRTRITPNTISIISFLLILLAAYLFLFNDYIYGAIAGILAQFSAILDGCDGEIARLRHKPSNFGAFFDTMLDRYSDIILITAIGFTRIGVYPLNLIFIYFAVALTAQLISGLARKEFTLRFNTPPPDNYFFRLTRRDARIFSIFIGALFGLAFELAFIYSLFVHALVISGYLRLASKLD